MSDSRITLTNGHPDPEWLGALHDGELSAVEERQVDAHVAACAQCREVLADLAELSRLAPDLEPELPASTYWPGLTERILDRVAEEEALQRLAVVARVAAVRRRTGIQGIWRTALPLAAVCGVALLSWRLLSSGPSALRQVGDPGPEYRSAPVKSTPAAPSTAQKAEGTLEALGRDDAPVGTRGGTKGSLAERETRRPEAKLQSAGARANRADQPPITAGEAEPDKAGGVSSKDEASIVEGATASGAPADLKKPDAPPTDSLLAAVTLQADSLWLRLGWSDGANGPGRQEALPFAKERAAKASTLADAAPGDSALARASLALEEWRLSLLKSLRPRADRTEFETRLERLRRFLKIPSR